MHDYSIDRSPKVRILFWLSAAAISATSLINTWLTTLIASAFGRTAAVALPIFLVFSALYAIVDKKLWKWPLARKYLLVPDLNGNWRCEGRTAFKDGAPADWEWTARIAIVQSWSKISIRLTTPQSGSMSTSASIVEHAHGFALTYTYRNDPRPGEAADLSKHDGVAMISFDRDHDRGDGRYFTDQHRQTSGTMRWTKE